MPCTSMFLLPEFHSRSIELIPIYLVCILFFCVDLFLFWVVTPLVPIGLNSSFNEIPAAFTACIFDYSASDLLPHYSSGNRYLAAPDRNFYIPIRDVLISFVSFRSSCIAAVGFSLETLLILLLCVILFVLRQCLTFYLSPLSIFCLPPTDVSTSDDTLASAGPSLDFLMLFCFQFHI